MDKIARFHQQLMLWRHLPGAVIAMTILVLGATVGAGTWQLRQSTRQQMIQREADILHSVALMQHLAGQSQDALGSELEDVADQFNLAMQISQLKDVVAARLYDADGAFLVAFPAYVTDGQLSRADRESLKQLRPVAHYDSSRALEDLFLEEFKQMEPKPESASVMEVAIPLHRMNSPDLLGVIQFAMDGRSIERQFSALDRNLLWQASLAFLIGAGLVAVVTGWAFRKLNHSNTLLMERTDTLQKANDELAMAARGSALGAVTAHLLHGLSNPLSGLSDYMAQRGEDAADDNEWRHAMASTRRMRQLVQDATRVLAEERNADRYELSLSDLLQSLHEQCLPMAKRHHVTLRMEATGKAALTNRQANLLCLILENILVNAVQASPSGKEVTLQVVVRGDHLVFDVKDQGPGIAPEMIKKLFKSCQSSKEGGSGIGLAICHQLANHLGASLNLRSTNSTGTIFSLDLPLRSPVLARDWALEKA